MGGRVQGGGGATRRRSHACFALALTLLGGSWLLLTATPATAAIVLNPASGPTGTSVGVSFTGLGDSTLSQCQVSFDGTTVATSANCRSGMAFVVPGSATAGQHDVSATAGGSGGSFSLGSATFTVDEPIVTPTTRGVTPTTEVPAVTAPPPAVTTPRPTPTSPRSAPTVVAPPVTVDGSAPTTTAETSIPGPVAGEATCSPSTPPIARVGAVPARAAAGAYVRIAVDWSTGGACAVRPGLLTFDGTPIGGPIPSTTGPVEVQFTVPGGAVIGPYTLAVVAVDDPVAALATAPFEVMAATDPVAASSSSSSGLPLGALLIGALVIAAGGAAAFVAHHRKPVPGALGSADRSELEEARRAASAAWREVERAQNRARAEGELASPALSSARPDPYLLEHENPHAPRRPNGKRGWYRTQRTQPVRAIVVNIVDPKSAHRAGSDGSMTAGSVASGLTSVARPSSAHVVVDGDGVVNLLPDDHVALGGPDGDETDESVLRAVVVPSPDGTFDDAALSHLAAWSGARLHAYGLPTRGITAGTVSGGPDFPWDRFLAALGDEPGANAESDGLAADAASAREQACLAETAARGAERRVDELVREATLRECRDLPAPEDLVAEGDSRYFLLDHENPNGGLRANGKYGWYYPTRSTAVRGIVVHTAESMDALAVAQHLSTTDQAAAAHVVVDTDVTVPLLPDETIAANSPDGDSAGLDIEIAYKAALWGTQPAIEELLLIRSAAWCGVRARAHGIPVRRVTVEEWEAGKQGFISNAELDPASRTDPGPDFPWDRFLTLTARVAALPGHAPAVAATSPSGPATSREKVRPIPRVPIVVGVLAAVLVAGVTVGILSRGDSEPAADAPVQSAPAQTTTVAPTVAGPPVRIDRALITASATSVLPPEEALTFGADNTLDENLGTAWNDGSPGSGAGEKLTYRFAKPVHLVGIRLVNGFAATPELFQANARMQAVVVLSDTGRFPVTLADVAEGQELTMDLGLTSSVILDVVSPYPGSEFEDLALTEIEFFARPA